MPLNPFDDEPAHATAKLSVTGALLLAGNLGAWMWAWIAFGDRPALMGIALLAYVFGLRHAFDADHIAAIDNVVRKLMQQGRTPYSVGFFFSLGHSTVVVLASVVIAVTAGAVQGRLFGGTVGTMVSALFLLIIARSGCCSASASTPRRRSACSASPRPRRRKVRRSGRSWCSRRCSPRACRCSTRRTAW